MNYVSLMLCCGKCIAVFDFSSSNVIRLISSQCYLITPYLINHQCAHCNLPNLHSPINFYALSSSLHFFSLSVSSFLWSGRFLFGPPPFSSTCFFLMCVWCVWCGQMTAGRCHTLLSPVTEESGEEGTNSEVSSPPACRSPSPGANADAPLNQVLQTPPWSPPKALQHYLICPTSILLPSNLHMTPQIHSVT